MFGVLYFNDVVYKDPLSDYVLVEADLVDTASTPCGIIYFNRTMSRQRFEISMAWMAVHYPGWSARYAAGEMLDMKKMDLAQYVFGDKPGIMRQPHVELPGALVS